MMQGAGGGAGWDRAVCFCGLRPTGAGIVTRYVMAQQTVDAGSGVSHCKIACLSKIIFLVTEDWAGSAHREVPVTGVGLKSRF